MRVILDLFYWGLANLKGQWKTLAGIILISAALYFAIKVLGAENELRQFLDMSSLSTQDKAIIGMGLFIWSCILFTTFIPLGTVTVLLAGYVLGISAGFIQFASMLFSSVFLYLVFKHPDPIYRIEKYTQNAFVLRVFKIVSNKGIWTVGLLRLVPVIPSAACVFISRILLINLTDMIKGTLIVGWVRPVFFAFLGSQLTRLAI